LELRIAVTGRTPPLISRADREPAPVRHGISRVDRQIHQNLFELARVEAHQEERGVEIQAKLDVLTEQARQQLSHAADDFVQIEHSSFDDLPASEGQEL